MKTSRSHVGYARRNMPRSRTVTMGAVRDLLATIFNPAAPEPGVALDFSDLTDAKLAWRRNLLSQTDRYPFPQYVVTNADVAPPAGIAGIAAAMKVETTAMPAVPAAAVTAKSTAATMTFYVKKGNTVQRAFLLRNVTTSTNLGSGTINLDTGVSAGTAVITSAGDGWLKGVITQTAGIRPGDSLLAYFGATAGEAAGINWYLAGIQVEDGIVSTPYQSLTDVYTEFLRDFPLHSLYRESTFQTPVMSMEDPIGGALDMRFGGARGPEIWPASAGTPSGWTNNGNGSYSHAGNSAGGSIGGSNVPGIPGKVYEVWFTVSGRTTGTVTPYLGSTGAGPAISANGVYHAIVTAAGVNGGYIFANIAFDGVVSNISFKEVYGNHATQPNVGDRPVVSARVNRYLNSAWTGGGNQPTGWVMAAGTTSGTNVPNGVVDGNTIYRQTATAQRPFLQPAVNVSLAVGQVMTNSVVVDTIYSGNFVLSDLVNWVAGTGNGTQVFALDGVVAPSNTPVVAGKRVAVQVTCTTAGVMTPRTGIGVGAPLTGDADFSRPMLTPGGIDQVGPYQRVNTATDYDAIGFPKGARFNGVNSWMSIDGLDLSGSDRLGWALSGRKDSDAARAAFFELTPVFTNPGSIGFFGPFLPNKDYMAVINDAGTSTTIGPAGPTLAAPHPVVASVQANLAGTASAGRFQLRMNGISYPAATGIAGGGSFANGVLYIGRRAGTALPFNGMIYRLAIRSGASDNFIASMERWANEPAKVLA